MLGDAIASKNDFFPGWTPPVSTSFFCSLSNNKNARFYILLRVGACLCCGQWVSWAKGHCNQFKRLYIIINTFHLELLVSLYLPSPYDSRHCLSSMWYESPRWFIRLYSQDPIQKNCTNCYYGVLVFDESSLFIHSMSKEKQTINFTTQATILKLVNLWQYPKIEV